MEPDRRSVPQQTTTANNDNNHQRNDNNHQRHLTTTTTTTNTIDDDNEISSTTTTTTTNNDDHNHQRSTTTTTNDQDEDDHHNNDNNDHNDQRPQRPQPPTTTTTTTTTAERRNNSVRKPAEVPIPRLQCLYAHALLVVGCQLLPVGSLKLGLSIDRYTRNWIATKSFDRVPGKAQDRDCCAEGEPNSWTVLRCHLLLGVAKSIKQSTSEPDHPAIVQVIAQVIVRPLQILIFRPLPLQLLIWSTPMVRTWKRSSPTAWGEKGSV